MEIDKLLLVRTKSVPFVVKSTNMAKDYILRTLISLPLHQIKRTFFWEKFLKLKAALRDHTK